MRCENCGHEIELDTEGDCNSYFYSEDNQHMEASCFNCRAVYEVTLSVESISLIGYYGKSRWDIHEEPTNE